MSGKAVRNWRGNGKAVTKNISCGNGKQPPLNVNSNYSCTGPVLLSFLYPGGRAKHVFGVVSEDARVPPRAPPPGAL